MVRGTVWPVVNQCLWPHRVSASRTKSCGWTPRASASDRMVRVRGTVWPARLPCLMCKLLLMLALCGLLMLRPLGCLVVFLLRLPDQPRPTMVDDPTDDDGCPGCGATHGVQPQPALPTVQAWSCTACGMHWACTVVNLTVRVALSIVSTLPTPQLRTAALLAVLRADVRQRSAKEQPMTVTICLPAAELFNIDAMASVDTVVWWCRLCDHHGTATTRPTAHSDSIEHLTTEHHATIGIAS